MNKHKHGLAVMRCQPFHIGHINLINHMLEDCDAVTVVLGSIQEKRTEKNPFSYQQRKEMIQNYYKNNALSSKMRILGIPDLGDDRAWSGYVMDFVKESCPDREKPDVYYCGTIYDSQWFQYEKIKFEIIDRTDQELPYCSGTMIRNMCMFQDVRWKLYIPECNWELVRNLESSYYYDRKGKL